MDNEIVNLITVMDGDTDNDNLKETIKMPG